MPVETSEKVVKGKGKAKADKVVNGAQPLPVADKVKDPVKDKELSELAKKQNAAIEETRKKLKELQEQLKKAKDEEKALKDQEKAAKDLEKNKGKAEREAKEAAIKAADEAVVAAQKDLEATEEWAFLVSAKEARAALGSLPKARKGGGGGGGTPKGPKGGAAGLKMVMVRLLRAMADGATRGSAELAELSGIAKGKPFPELYDMGLINIEVPAEGERGRRFTITDAGLEALEKAEAELASKSEEAPAAEAAE